MKLINLSLTGSQSRRAVGFKLNLERTLEIFTYIFGCVLTRPCVMVVTTVVVVVVVEVVVAVVAVYVSD